MVRLARLFNAIKFVRSLKRRIDNQENRLAVLNDNLNNLRTELEARSLAQMASSSLTLRERIGLRISREATRNSRKARLAVVRDMQADLKELERLFPNVFPIWGELFENAKVEYIERPNQSLSVAGNPGAELFRKYLLAELSGHVLDIGCGPLPLPHYLVGQNVDRIAGIDPLPGVQPREFEFVQGFAEFLPWPDSEFDAVTIATSLDHVLSLDMAFAEIKRVLVPDGVVAMWVGFVKGAKEYDPLAENIVPIDPFHIFHFDRPWFLNLINKHFVVCDELVIDTVSVFYSLKPRR
jgi:SAM-dependent methyltransferase